MSILFAWVVSLFLAFLPTAMVLYYKSKGSTAVIIFLLNLFGFVTLGITTLIAFVFAAFSIGIKNTLKSLLFSIVLILLSGAFVAGEIAAIFALIA